MFPDRSLAPVELLLVAGDHAWASRLAVSQAAARQTGDAAAAHAGGGGGGAAARVVRAVQAVRASYGVFLASAYAQGAPVPLHVFTRLGAAAGELGDLDEAVDVYRQGARQCSGAASAWKGLGLCLLQQGRFTEAEAALDLSNERDNSDALVWGCVALCNLQDMLRQGSTGDQYRMAAVGESIKEAHGLGLDDVGLLFELSACYAKCDRYREATDLLRRAIELRGHLDRRAAAGGPVGASAAAAAAGLPSAETMRNCLADALKSQGYDLDALDMYQAVFEACLDKQEAELGVLEQEGSAAEGGGEGGEASDETKSEAKSEGGKNKQGSRLSRSRVGGSAAAGKPALSSKQGSLAASSQGDRATDDQSALSGDTDDESTGGGGGGGSALGATRAPSDALVAVVLELNRAAKGIESLLSKLGRGSELKQLRYSVKMINARLQTLNALAGQAQAP